MTKLNYNVNISNLDILKTEYEQHSLFFNSGHPMFLIPDFCNVKADIWTSYLEYIEKIYNCECYDQEGGEITSHSIINIDTGLTKCTYTAYEVVINDGDDPQDIDVEIEGYVVCDNDVNYFLATKVIENYKIKI